jgi:hypothetical protein
MNQRWVQLGCCEPVEGETEEEPSFHSFAIHEKPVKRPCAAIIQLEFFVSESPSTQKCAKTVVGTYGSLH